METNNIEKDFSRLRVLTSRQQSMPPLTPSGTTPSTQASPPRSPSKQMDEATWETKDLQSALEESTKHREGHSGSNVLRDNDSAEVKMRTVTPSRRRRVWRRRCKSTSNLSNLSNTVQSGNDTSSTEDEDEDERKSEHLKPIKSREGSDSEEMKEDEEEGVVSVNVKKSGLIGVLPSARRNFPIESDSVNETISPLRPNTKRKRKFKRMALDPDPGPSGSGQMNAKIGNKKHKNRTRYEFHVRHPQLMGKTSSTGIVVGKRKRSNREKSVEPEHLMMASVASSSISALSSSVQGEDEASVDFEMNGTGRYRQNQESRQSSSSLSSSEWEDSSDNLDSIDNGREADDEQSDWPGHETNSTGTHFASQLTDTEDADINLDTFLSGETMLPMTATARQAYLARMKRLAECVPGREIRAGTRKVRNRQTGFTIKSSSSEQLSRFLQDPSRTELKLTVLRSSDRNKVIHLANLYSLSVRTEENSNLLVLSKTGKTVRVKSEFAVPGAAKAPIEFKRRRRTPPNSPLLEGSSTSNDMTATVDASTSDVTMLSAPDETLELKRAISNRSISPTIESSQCNSSQIVKAKFSGSLSN